MTGQHPFISGFMTLPEIGKKDQKEKLKKQEDKKKGVVSFKTPPLKGAMTPNIATSGDG